MPEGSALKEALTLISSGFFCPEEGNIFQPIIDTLTLHGDQYMLAADFDEYIVSQALVAKDYRDQKEWTRKAIINVANMGMFSSDRTIGQYANEIWQLEAVTVK